MISRIVVFLLLRVVGHYVQRWEEDHEPPPPERKGEGVLQLAGLDPLLVWRLGARHQRRLRAIALATWFTTALAGSAALITTWFAFEHAGLALIVGLGAAILMHNLLRLLLSGAALPLVDDPEPWRPTRAPLVLLATYSLVMSQPILIALSTALPGGSVQAAQEALVALRREPVEEAHSTQVARQREEVKSLGHQARNWQHPSLVLQDRLDSARERLAAMSLAGPAFVTDLVPYEFHVEHSTLIAHQLAFAWSRPLVAIPTTLFFVTLGCWPLLLRVAYRRSFALYLYEVWTVDQAVRATAYSSVRA